MADKASFTKDEWALLLRSPMNAGMAITAAEPSGLFGLLKEAFAGGTALAQAATDPNTNPLIKAVVSDFQTSDGRAAAHDGLKAELRIPVILKHSLRERNSWRIRLGLVVG